jgi:hypothetical protein
MEAGVADALIGAAAAGMGAAFGVAAAVPAHARAVATKLIGPAGVAGVAAAAVPALADLIGSAALTALAAMARVRLEIDAGVLVPVGLAAGQAQVAGLGMMMTV